MLEKHDYGPDGVCNRCSHDSFSSGSDYCENNPKYVLDRIAGLVKNPKYIPTSEEAEDEALSDDSG